MRVSTRLKTLVRPIHKEGWPVAATLCGILCGCVWRVFWNVWRRMLVPKCWGGVGRIDFIPTLVWRYSGRKQIVRRYPDVITTLIGTWGPSINDHVTQALARHDSDSDADTLEMPGPDAGETLEARRKRPRLWGRAQGRCLLQLQSWCRP